MKKYFSILIFIFISFFNIADTKANVDAIALRDSILEIIDTIEPAQKKTQFLRSQVLTHIGKPWTLDLLDTALVISRNSAIREDEAHVIFDYARHYQFMRDRENFTKYLAILKEHCYKYKTYGIYLSAWMGEMQLYSSNGNTEYVIMEAQKVKDEINRLGYDRGISVVNLVLGQALSTAGKKKEAIEVYQSIVEANVINENGMMRIHSRLMGLFIDLERYDEALNQLCLRDSILKKVVSETPVMERSKYNNYWLETYLGYADIYWALRDKDNLKKYKIGRAHV